MANGARKHSPTECLRFGPARYTNDPREAKDWRFTYRGGGSKKPDIVAIGREVAEVLQSTAKLFCLARDDRDRFGTDEVFGRGFSHSAMWAHYAGGHSGVCLIFERDALATSFRDEFATYANCDLFAGEVTYHDYAHDEIDAFSLDLDRIEEVGVSQAAYEHFLLFHAVLFFRKNVDWSAECEYRWLVRTPRPAPEFAPVGDALAGIVVGENFPARERSALEYFARELGNPRIATLQLHTGYPDLVFWDASGIVSMRARLSARDSGRPLPPNHRISLD